MPNPEPTPKIFISYAWKNQTIAKRLQSDLQRDGVEVFVDYEKITGGDSLPQRISAALDWCNTLVLLWSADAVESYYVRQEWSSAFHLQKKIIACVLDNTKLPALLSGNLYLNFSPYETGYAELCRSLGVTPKTSTEQTASPEVTIGKLSPLRIKMSAPDKKRESPLPAPPQRKSFAEALRRKPKPPDPAPILKPPEIFNETKNDDADAAEMIAPARWSRRKIMSAALALIIVAALVIWLKSCSGNFQSVLTPALPDSSYIEIAS